MGVALVASAERAHGSSAPAAPAGADQPTDPGHHSSILAEVKQYGDPLVARLRGPEEGHPTKEDFFRIPLEFERGRLVKMDELLAALKSEAGTLKYCKHRLADAGARGFPYDSLILPVAVAIYCMHKVTGFPPELCAQTYAAAKAVCLHIDAYIKMRGSVCVKPRAPQIGVAAPGSKKTPVQTEICKRTLIELVLNAFPFLFHCNEEFGGLCWEGGNTAGFLKQLRGNKLYVFLLIEELLSFFDINYPHTGITNQQHHLLPALLLPLRTGNGLSKAMSSDLANKVSKSQVAMSFMAQEDVIKEVFCKRALSTGFLQGFSFVVPCAQISCLLCLQRPVRVFAL